MSRMAKTLVTTKYEGIVQDVVRHALRFRCQGFLSSIVSTLLDGSLLSSQSVEEDNDVLPGLQLVAAEAQGSTDEIGRFGRGNEVVAIEEL